MLALGFLVAMLVAAWRARREGENPDHIHNAGILALLGGIIGARLFDVIEYAERPRAATLSGQPALMYHDWLRGFNIFDGLAPLGLLLGALFAGLAAAVGVLPTPRKNNKHRYAVLALWAVAGALVVGRGLYIRSARAQALDAGLPDPYAGFIEALRIIDGGLTVYGGLLLGAILVSAYLVILHRRHGVNPLKMADIIAPSLALGLAFGRVGCFLNGCCYGAPTTVPWAITWPGPSPEMSEGSLAWQAGVRVPVHPSQIYSALNGLLIFLVLHLGYRWKKRHGVLIGAFFVMYAPSRFLLECLRSDEPKIYLGGLSISQSLSLFILAAAALYFLWLPHSKMSDLLWQPGSASGAAGAPRNQS